MDQQVSSTKQFMVLQDGRQVGPLKAAELQSQARKGAISPLDSVCAVGSDKWVLGYQVKGLFPAWLAAEIRERLAKGEGVDDLLPQNAESVAAANSAEQPQADDMVLAPLEESGWYWLDEGKRFGPVNVEVIGSMLESGVLAEQSQVARSQGGPWLAPSLFPELAQRLPTASHHRSPRTQSHTGKQTTASRRMPVAGVVGLVAIVLLTAVMVPITMLESGALSDGAVDAIAGGSRGSSSPQSRASVPARDRVPKVSETIPTEEPARVASSEPESAIDEAVRREQDIVAQFADYALCVTQRLGDYQVGSDFEALGRSLILDLFDVTRSNSLLTPIVGELHCTYRDALFGEYDVIIGCRWQNEGWAAVEVSARFVGPSSVRSPSNQMAISNVKSILNGADISQCR